jgi:hypothetical protein
VILKAKLFFFGGFMKRLILIALIISAAAGVVFAQLGAPGWASPQSDATSGRIRSTADDFIRPDAYTNLKFDKFFGMTSYRSASAVSLGYAGKVGDLYIGTYYGGSFWAGIPSFTYREDTRDWLNETDKGGVKSYATLPALGAGTPNNTLSLLIGAADMGFRASVATTKKMFSDSDFVVGSNYYKNYEIESGNIAPQFAWSMAKNLADNGIKPYVVFDMTLTKNYAKNQQYVRENPGDPNSTYVPAEESVTQSDINNLVRIRTGLGGYTLLNNNGFRFSADLDYDLRLTFYDNEYNYMTLDNKNQIKTGFKGTITNPSAQTGYTETSLTNHTITPSVSGQWSGGPLAFRFKVNLPVNIQNNVYTQMAFKLYDPNVATSVIGDGSLAKNGNDYTTSIIGFNPNIALAAQWKIIPKIALNLGGSINLNSITTTTTEGKTFTNGVENDNSSYRTVATTNPNAITNTLVTGFTFLATDNVTFEVASGATNGTFDVFGTSGGDSLLYFTNLLVSLKF